MNRKEKIALVTGSNRGIGKQVALDLAAQGIFVIVTSRNKTEGKLTQQEIISSGGKADFFPLDVSNEKSVLSLFDYIKKTYARLDILINNAGVYLDHDGFSGTTREETAKTLETNLVGPLRLCQLFLPMMRENEYGRIVNVSSGMGQMSDMGAGYPAYRISKSAINALTIIVSKETIGRNIKVNSVCPGWVRTDMGGPSAERTIEHGAETIVWAALLPETGATGKFFRDKKEIPW
ncbi:short-chain dehydrogenase [Leptospira kobayashii]|uniref:Short-chain dehydrogenase n=1 Tax=Leptospira kobayashii TaxID=1917830 RepID=A0ABM7URC2_9LEPT|nr:SDR family oxidoreductase [Leptospira kobayashii]BDA77640.1 short-chain dehydrogenase [Leptospira kobayashii]